MTRELLLTKEEIEARARDIKNEYQRNWRAQNPDKVRKHNKRYYEKKAIESYLKEFQGGEDD